GVTNAGSRSAGGPLDAISSSTLFLVASGFGMSSTVQAYWLTQTESSARDAVSWLWVRLLVLNLSYWYVPALLAPLIMRLSLRWQPGRIRWPRVVVFHAAAVL